MKYTNYYFKWLADEEPGMSGLCLPEPSPDLEFEDCEFHPRLWEALQQMYSSAKFVACNGPRMGGKRE